MLQVRKNVVNLKNSICMEQYAYDFVVNRYSQIFMQNVGIVFDHIMAAPAWAFDELQLNLSDFTSCLRSSIYSCGRILLNITQCLILAIYQKFKQQNMKLR